MQRPNDPHLVRRAVATALALASVVLTGACTTGSAGRPAEPAVSVLGLTTTRAGAPSTGPTGASASPTATASATASPPATPTTPATPTAPATPTPLPAPAGRAPTGRAVTIAFGGDVHFEGASRAALSGFGPVAAVLSRADLAMVNLETAVTWRGSPQPKEFNFRAPPAAFAALAGAGIDVATMANNHGMDYGLVGLRDSLAAAAAVKFPVVGIGADETAAFAPYRRLINGQRVAIIGATQVLDDQFIDTWSAGPRKPGLASAKHVSKLLAAVASARLSADTVVVYLHWGAELAACPTANQRALEPRLVAAGADVVVGSHAHVLLGGGWTREGAYVDYGLGNFVFYASGGASAQTGVLLLTIRGRAVTGATWQPAVIASGRPVPLTGTAATDAAKRWSRLRSCTGLAARRPT